MLRDSVTRAVGHGCTRFFGRKCSTSYSTLPLAPPFGSGRGIGFSQYMHFQPCSSMNKCLLSIQMPSPSSTRRLAIAFAERSLAR